MKSKDPQNIVLSKYQKGDTATEIRCPLNSEISLATNKSWCQMICQSGSIQLLGARAAPQMIRALKKIYKKLKIACAESRKDQLENLQGSSIFLQQIDLGLKLYKKTIESPFSDGQRIKRKQFPNWLQTNFRKKDILRALFSDEKFFDMNGV